MNTDIFFEILGTNKKAKRSQVPRKKSNNTVFIIFCLTVPPSFMLSHVILLLSVNNKFNNLNYL